MWQRHNSSIRSAVRMVPLSLCFIEVAAAATPNPPVRSTNIFGPASTSAKSIAALTQTLAIVFAGGVYLRGWLHRYSIPAWRARSFVLGLLATWVAMVSPIASLDSRMLMAHMIQHLLLMTIAPPLIWLGEPLLTARPTRWPVPMRLGNLLTHPAFCWLTAATALVAWHVPAIFRLCMQSATWHSIEQASFLTTGLLFWWPVIQPWPSTAVWPRWSILLYLFLATLPCDVLSGLLVFSYRIA